jgi:large subunit ribosomal protein L25
MAKHAQLHAETRQLLGKKVRRLRAAGILPATVYGHNIKPASIQVVAHDMRVVLRTAGRTQLIDLVIDEEKARPVFVKQTSIDPKRNSLLHVEFYQANLLEKITVSVPIRFTGESQAVKDGGILLTMLDHIDVEALPDNVPSDIEVNLDSLAEFNAALHAADLTIPAGATLLTPTDEIVVKVNPPISEAAVEEIITEAAPLPEELGGEEPSPESVPEA